MGVEPEGGGVRVCHVIHNLQPGGAEALLVDLARSAAQAGLELSVVQLVDHPDPSTSDRLRALDVPVVSLGLSSRWDPRAFPRALRALRRLDPAVVHTHLKHADLVGGAVAHRLGVPHVSTLHLIEADVGPLGRAKRWLAGQGRRFAALTIAVSEAQREWYLASFPADPARVVTIRNGVTRPEQEAAGRLAGLREEWQVGRADVLAVNVAVMRPGKGHEDLLQAAARLPEDSCLRLVLVGDGENRASLERLVDQDPRLTGRVRFAGFRSDVATVLQAADLVVHPTHADALPTALIEALATGTPAVATRVGGVPEVVGDAGELVEVGDVAALAATMDALARDPGRREELSARARRRFDEEFDADRWARRLRERYAELLRSHA